MLEGSSYTNLKVKTMRTFKTNITLLAVILFFMGCNQTKEKSDGWMSLFNASDLTGWTSTDEEISIKIENGAISLGTPGSMLYYEGAQNDADFKNFEFRTEVLTTSDAMAGIYFHTETPADGAQPRGYMVQIMNSNSEASDFRKTGSLLAIRDVYKNMASDEEWFNLHISVMGNRIKVYVNDVQTVDYTEHDHMVREEHLAGRKLSSGTFAILAGEKPVYFKNIEVNPLPDDIQVEAGNEYFAPEKQALVDKLIGRGYPMIDYHIHMKGGVTLDDILDKSRRTGIFCSVAPNCGVGFPIDTNEKLEEFYQEYQNVPIFLAMQAEGREWVTTFEKESIAKYDYVFTDAMTFSDRKGNRMQIWIDEQVVIDDAQDFMELLVSTIEEVLDNEKIDIYANATFLPTVIADDYDLLWTDERMERVANALARNNIALEVSARYHIPGPALIKKAMAKGVKISFGTNNSDHDYANLDYCLEILELCNLQPDDFFIPKPHGLKPVQVK
jgi:hypothetical protein